MACAIVIFLTDETPRTDYLEAAKELRDFVENGATFIYAKHIFLVPNAQVTGTLLGSVQIMD